MSLTGQGHFVGPRRSSRALQQAHRETASAIKKNWSSTGCVMRIYTQKCILVQVNGTRWLIF